MLAILYLAVTRQELALSFIQLLCSAFLFMAQSARPYSYDSDNVDVPFNFLLE